MSTKEPAVIPFVRRDLEVTLAPTFRDERDSAVAVASMSVEVSTDDEYTSAMEALKEVRRLRLGAEKAHKEAKKPVLDCGRKLDSILTEAIDPLQKEEYRLNRLCGDWVALQRAKALAAAAAEEAKRRDEENALQAKLAQATSLDEHQAIREEAAVEAAVKAQLEMPIVTAPAVAAAPIREEWELTFTDLIALATWALKANLPHLVDITPKKRAIGELLDRGMTIPGVEAKKVNKVNIR